LKLEIKQYIGLPVRLAFGLAFSVFLIIGHAASVLIWPSDMRFNQQIKDAWAVNYKWVLRG